ncbi:N-acetyllactosaminide alpha-1,3-galactosyltransferase-like isoform X2 [Rana temporaria]|uniref:N-acetyllactosaminide alpha-1,3-galactosyltransferase-like isoform X2 n=1 Tax=Rana temporaria TaxID=8407 RepID=UPI001AADA179|nr:N-acetyllactosaminide alpha-1,3-galactosyltransferase-like isoform X2 [Rana temporaria]
MKSAAQMTSMVNRKRIFLCIVLCLSLTAHFFYVKSLICFPKVPATTSWGAPIVWEGAYDSEKENRFHQKQRTVVGLSVFAVNQYLESYLADFLVSANIYFMPNLSCVFYILTDRPDDVPDIKLRPGVSKVILQISKRSRWQDISMLRMQDLLDLVLPRAVEQVDYLFCMDVDQIFTSIYGPEVLGDLVAQLHSGFYLANKEDFTYERDPRSAAYIPPGKGQFYYHAAIFGGTPARLVNLTSSCLKGIVRDKEHNVEAVWHDESHLNRYFALERLPLKILSPEYCWDNRLWLKYHKLVWAKKLYSKIRL